MSDLANHTSLSGWPYTNFDGLEFLEIPEYFFVAYDPDDAAVLWRLLELEKDAPPMDRSCYPIWRDLASRGNIPEEYSASFPMLISFKMVDNHRRPLIITLKEIQNMLRLLVTDDQIIALFRSATFVHGEKA